MAACRRVGTNTGSIGISSNSDRAITRIYVDIHNNSGTVVLGENIVVNRVCSSLPSTATGLGREHDAHFSNARTTENDANTASRPRSCDYVTFSRGKRSLNDEGFVASASCHQLCQDCKRAGSLAYEGSEFSRKKKRDRMRMKRQKRRSSITSSDDQTPASALNKELPLESGNNSSFEQALRLFHSYSKCLQPLRDNGCWADFDRDAQELLSQTGGDLTCQILICLEKGVSLSYQRKLEESEDTLNDAKRNIAKISGPVRLLLEVLSECYRAQLFRRTKMLGKTLSCLERATKISSGFPPCLPVATLLYEYGSYKQDFAAILRDSGKECATKDMQEQAKKEMQRCVDLCRSLDRKTVYLGKEHFAVSKMANMNLQCETSASRKENINSRNIKEAEKGLQTLRSDDYCNNEAQGAKIQRLKLEVNLKYRKKEFPEAEKIAQEALEIAGRLGFNLEREPFEDRLKEIRCKIIESSRPSSCDAIYREIPRAATDSSSGSPPSRDISPQSSEYEVDQLASLVEMAACIPTHLITLDHTKSSMSQVEKRGKQDDKKGEKALTEILQCGYSNQSYRAVLSWGAVHYAEQGGSNFRVWGCATIEMKATGLYFQVELLIMLYKGGASLALE